MTTIVWDGKTLAGDSQSTSENTITSMKCNKIFVCKKNDNHYKIEGESVLAFGYGGLSGSDKIIANALNSNLCWDDEFPKDFEFCAIVITQSLKCYLIQKDKNESSIVIVEGSDKYALGSGRDFALAALNCGADAKKAVEIAISLDAYSGGKVVSVNLGEEK